jgi:hypothetical protein
MMSTAVMAFFGFFFWILNAMIFIPDQVIVETILLIFLITLFPHKNHLGRGIAWMSGQPTTSKLYFILIKP